MINGVDHAPKDIFGMFILNELLAIVDLNISKEKKYD